MRGEKKGRSPNQSRRFPTYMEGWSQGGLEFVPAARRGVREWEATAPTQREAVSCCEFPKYETLIMPLVTGWSHAGYGAIHFAGSYQVWPLQQPQEQALLRGGHRLREDQRPASIHCLWGCTCWSEPQWVLPQNLGFPLLYIQGQTPFGMLSEQEFPVLCHFKLSCAKPHPKSGRCWVLTSASIYCPQYTVLRATQEPHVY